MAAKPKPETKELILSTTLDLYLESGIEGLSMRKVAKQAGLSAMSPYRHFKNKEDLLNHVVLEGFQCFQGFFTQAQDIQDPAESLRRCAELYLEFALEHPKFYEVLFMSVVQLTEPSLQNGNTEKMNTSLQFLEQRVKNAQDSGQLDEGQPRDLALHLWSHCHGLISLHLIGRMKPNSDFLAFYQRSINRLFQGLGLRA